MTDDDDDDDDNNNNNNNNNSRQIYDCLSLGVLCVVQKRSLPQTVLRPVES
jgi:hypothetical protein